MKKTGGSRYRIGFIVLSEQLINAKERSCTSFDLDLQETFLDLFDGGAAGQPGALASKGVGEVSRDRRSLLAPVELVFGQALGVFSFASWKPWYRPLNDI